MDEKKTPLSNEEEKLARSEADLQRLEGRLESLREPEGGGNRQFARGVGLVASLGFVLAGCLYGGLLLGDYLVLKTGYPFFQLGGVLLGLVTALFAGVKLLKPLMGPSE